jgi:hypothetical protein
LIAQTSRRTPENSMMEEEEEKEEEEAEAQHKIQVSNIPYAL